MGDEGARDVSLDENDEALPLPVISCAVDDVALAALMRREPDEPEHCDSCGEPIEGEPAGRGLYLWSRGDDVQLEEPPLCAHCATTIGVTALQRWQLEDESDG